MKTPCHVEAKRKSYCRRSLIVFCLDGQDAKLRQEIRKQKQLQSREPVNLDPPSINTEKTQLSYFSDILMVHPRAGLILRKFEPR